MRTVRFQRSMVCLWLGFAAGASQAAVCPIDSGFSAAPPRVVTQSAETGAMGSMAARVDDQGRPWIAAFGDGLFPGNATSQLVLARLDATGRRDPAFGVGGVRLVQVPAASQGFSGGLAFAPDGDAVALWNFRENGAQTIVLARVSAQGALRDGFGAGGIARLSCASTGQGQRFATGIAVDATGRILVALNDRGTSGTRGFVARLDASGGFDAAFGSGGCVDLAQVTGGAAGGSTGGLTVDGNDRAHVVVVAPGPTRVVRLSAVGVPDAGFGTAGVAATGLADSASFAPIAIGPGGRILVAQTTAEFDGMAQRPLFEAAALTSNGQPDPAFDGDGRMRFVVADGDSQNDLVRDVLVSADGDIALVGQSLGQMAVLRIDASGALDSRDCDAFNTYRIGPGLTAPAVASGGALRDGRIILLGHVGTPAGSQLGDLVALALRPALLLADGFEPAAP
jgi:uncharacterized delta-60 repeat protein